MDGYRATAIQGNWMQFKKVALWEISSSLHRVKKEASVAARLNLAKAFMSTAVSISVGIALAAK